MSHLPSESQARKERPITSGVIDYFPDALVEVAHVSYVGNQQHNPGQPLHWAREKSRDHADCIARHLLDRGSRDDDGVRHSAKMAWRALALLQLEIEAEQPVLDLDSPGFHKSLSVTYDATNPPTFNGVPVGYVPSFSNIPASSLVFSDIPGTAYMLLAGSAVSPPRTPQEEAFVFSEVQDPTSFETGDSEGVVDSVNEWPVRNDFLGAVTPEYAAHVHPAIIKTVMRGLTVNPTCRGIVYVSGPMRGYEEYNFPAFDDARNTIYEAGYNVISPADMDRAEGIDPETPTEDLPSALEFVSRDVGALLMLQGRGGFISMLPGWEHSTGAVAELLIARWLGVPIIDHETGTFLDPEDVDYAGLYESLYNYLSEGNIEAFTHSKETVG